MPGCPRRWTRHHCHLISYALVSFSLMFLGVIFSVFAIFVKESDLSKVWLAGPTTIAVGLVLCGKVMIDCRPTIGSSDDFDDDDMYDDEFVFDGELADDPSLIAQKQLVNSIDAQYQKNKQQVTLFIPNVGVVDKELFVVNCSDVKGKSQLDTESEIWNLRTSVDEERSDLSTRNSASSSHLEDKPGVEDCLCVISNEQAEHALLPSYPPTISPNPAAENSRTDGKKSKKCRELKLQVEAGALVDSSPSPLYHGDTFVLHEKQYLI